MALFKFTILYRRVDDEMALEMFFSETHLPLTEQLPGLLRTEVGRVRGKPGGESRFHMSYAAYFADEDSFASALASEIGVALMQALKPWADAKIVTWFYTDSYEETRPLPVAEADTA